MDFLPFAKPCITQDDIDLVVNVLESGWITTGQYNNKLEELICSTVGAKFAVASTSATAALHIYLACLDIEPGDEVITPSMTWVSTVNMITIMDATPVFCDVDKNTLMATAAHIEPLITNRTKLIMPVHFAGAPADMTPIRQLAKSRGIHLIEDAAQALGTFYQGTPVGETGTAFFSFQATKNATGAEGGILVTDDEKLAQRVRRLRYHGLDASSYDRKTQGRSPHASVVEPGFKYNLPDINAALAFSQLQRLGEIIHKRTELAHAYLSKLGVVDGLTPIKAPDYPHLHSWHLFVVRVDESRLGISRDAFIIKMKENNIGVGIHFHAVHRHPYYHEWLGPQPGLPNTDIITDQVCSLPLFPDMSEADIDRVVSTIRAIT